MLTNSSKRILYELFKEYKIRYDAGLPMDQCKNFSNVNTVHDTILQDYPVEDIEHCFWELKRAGYLDIKGADNTIWYCRLTPDAISFMQNLPKDTLKNFATFLAALL